MLEERWRQIVATHGNTRALHDGALNFSWSFTELAALADRESVVLEGGFACPRGLGVDFVLGVLRAWRAGAVVCPLEAGQTVPVVPPLPAGIRHLKLTSGTTAGAKVVGFTPAQLAADADQIVRTMGLRPDWPNLGVISLAHSYGFSSLVTPLLLQGIPLLLGPSALPAAVQTAALSATDLTLPAVPALWRTWQAAGAIPAGVRLAISAGAPLPLGLEQTVFRERGLKLHNFLGASECGGIAYDRTEEPRTEADWVGTALVGVQLERSADGCLVVTSPAVGSGYWPDPDERLGAGRFVSGDVVAVDACGAVRLQGRATDFINVAGRKVAPDAIEAELLRHVAVADCLAFAVPDEAARGEAVGIAVVRKTEVNEAALRAHLQAQLPAWQLPRRWWFVANLAPDGRGKLSRRVWRERLLGGPQSGT
jgi:acyl-CoA synthetase (AMP-forming)/AMP-acid ligase II